jgi:peptide/nickel transport system ATP-binding protein
MSESPSANVDQTTLQVRGLSVAYATPAGLARAVSDVSFDLHRREITGVVGESGSGKSTLALAVLKLLKPPGMARGQVFYQGKDIFKLEPEELRRIRWKGIAYIPQGSMNSLNPVIRIRDQFRDIIKAHEPGASKEEVYKIMTAALERVSLQASSVLGSFPHQLSGGMKQRVIIAMAIGMGPEIIIADEPTTALDVVTQDEIIRLLRQLRDSLDLTVMLISHDISILAEICDTMRVMYGGRIVESAPAREILDSPKHPYTMGLIASIPRLGRARAMSAIPGEPPNLLALPTGCVFHPRCKYVMDICKTEDPEPRMASELTEVRCHLYS